MSSVAHLHRADLFGFRAGALVRLLWRLGPLHFGAANSSKNKPHERVFRETEIAFQRLFTTVSRFSNHFQMFLFCQAFQRNFIRVAGVCVCA